MHRPVSILRHTGGTIFAAQDDVAIEAPLELRVRYTARTGDIVTRALAVTMRTPGHDADLARGFLWTEGITRTLDDLAALTPDPDEPNRLVIDFAPGTTPVLAASERNFYTTSSCGVCGKAALESVRVARGLPPPPPDQPRLAPALLATLPERLRAAQPAFAATGGLHAAGLFWPDGELLLVREDVGRHNAVDKVIGARVAARTLPAHDAVLVVSGRASFELVQKAVLAGLPALVAVGAPSSLAVELAREFGLTLLGFTRDARFNCYAGEARLAAL